MTHIILGATGRLAKELTENLRSRGIAPLLVSSKNKDSINSLSSIRYKACVVYDFMSASRPGFIGDIALEDEIRDQVMAIPFSNIHRYIYISTAGELYKGKGMIKHPDDWQLKPEIGAYAKRKLDVERLLLNTMGDKARILRVTNIYGGTFKSTGLGVVDNWLESYKEGRRPNITSTVDTFRNYIHVDCVIEEITSQIEGERLVILDTEDYYFLSDLHKMIFNEELLMSRTEIQFDLSIVAKRKKTQLQQYIKAKKKGGLRLQ